jgi:hypothetical protein
MAVNAFFENGLRRMMERLCAEFREVTADTEISSDGIGYQTFIR